MPFLCSHLVNFSIPLFTHSDKADFLFRKSALAIHFATVLLYMMQQQKWQLLAQSMAAQKIRCENPHKKLLTSKLDAAFYVDFLAV